VTRLFTGRLGSSETSSPTPSTSTGEPPTPLPSTPPVQPPPGELAALTTVLQAELATVYGYGVVGAQAGHGGRDRAAERLQWHALNRDSLAAQLTLAGKPPPPGPAAYALPFDVDSPESARALAAHLELGVAAAYADLVAAAGPSRRLAAAQAQATCAVAAQDWGAVLSAFPGLPERDTGG
jgi:hypothetical protein